MLSWVSALTLVCGFIALPLMDKSLTYTQVRCLFCVEEPLQGPSFFRFFLACFRKGWFPKEDVFVTFAEELEKRKNVANMMKAKKTVRRLCEYTLKWTYDVICSDDDFNDPDHDVDFPLKHLNNPAEARRTATFEAQREEKKKSEAEKNRASLLKWFDQGSDGISLYFERNGHGSKVSLCLTVIFGVGFLVFLSFFGVFKYNTIT